MHLLPPVSASDFLVSYGIPITKRGWAKVILLSPLVLPQQTYRQYLPKGTSFRELATKDMSTIFDIQALLFIEKKGCTKQTLVQPFLVVS